MKLLFVSINIIIIKTNKSYKVVLNSALHHCKQWCFRHVNNINLFTLRRAIREFSSHDLQYTKKHLNQKPWIHLFQPEGSRNPPKPHVLMCLWFLQCVHRQKFFREASIKKRKPRNKHSNPQWVQHSVTTTMWRRKVFNFYK